MRPVSAEGNGKSWEKDAKSPRTPVWFSVWARFIISGTVSAERLTVRRFWIFSKQRIKPGWFYSPGTAKT
ncbi:MAG: hypothetical protein BWK80_46795 [Desulfobacteraceae bacterium IS3]|nr:MAG: hypothetical protein BWK80_46795 [Desulfobacteraceae bacterium IS3]